MPEQTPPHAMPRTLSHELTASSHEVTSEAESHADQLSAAAAEVAPPHAGALSADSQARETAMLQLQNQIGNWHTQTVVARQLAVQRQNVPAPAPAPAPGATPAPAPPSSAIPDDLRRFRERGVYGGAAGQTIRPSTGMGGFNAKYDANAMVLTIIVNIEMEFRDGISISGDRLVANDPGIQALVDTANRTRGADRTRVLQIVRDRWQWPASGGTDEASNPDMWMARYRTDVAAAWQRKHTFRASRTGWESQLANVDIQINTTKVLSGGQSAVGGAPSGARSPTHTRATIFRTAPANSIVPIVGGVGGRDVGAEVGPGSASSAMDQTLRLSSSQLLRPVSKLTHSVIFTAGSSSLDSDARADLANFIITFQAPQNQHGTSIEIIGHANTVGGTPERNQEVSEQRAQAVANFLRTAKGGGHPLAGAPQRITAVRGAGTTDAGEGPEWRRVDVVVAGGQAQNVAAHEFGHMIGLGDEYAVEMDRQGRPTGRGLIRGTGNNVGTPADHDQLGRDMGLGGSVHENNDSVMSLGSTVRPQHYATFMSALRSVTGMDEWELRR